MLNVDDLISFGYFRKWYHELKKDYMTIHAYSKDYINKIAQFRNDNSIKGELFKENKKTEKEAIQYARDVIKISLDSMNRQNLTIDQIKERYSS